CCPPASAPCATRRSHRSQARPAPSDPVSSPPSLAAACRASPRTTQSSGPARRDPHTAAAPVGVCRERTPHPPAAAPHRSSTYAAAPAPPAAEPQPSAAILAPPAAPQHSHSTKEQTPHPSAYRAPCPLHHSVLISGPYSSTWPRIESPINRSIRIRVPHPRPAQPGRVVVSRVVARDRRCFCLSFCYLGENLLLLLGTPRLVALGFSPGSPRVSQVRKALAPGVCLPQARPNLSNTTAPACDTLPAPSVMIKSPSSALDTNPSTAPSPIAAYSTRGPRILCASASPVTPAIGSSLAA